MNFIEVRKLIEQFVLSSPLNAVEELGRMTIFDEPLVGAAAADDPLFLKLQDSAVVGAHHWLPADWLEGAKTVISYFLPFSHAVRKANRQQGVAAKEWLYGRIEGEAMNAALRAHIVEKLQASGYRAIAPSSDSRHRVIERRSNWSERHVAFVAGLGTFSLSRSLITERGSAGRIGSVVVNFELEPTRRLYQTYDEYCSYCGACILRCPPLAITESGKDNAVCSDYLERVLNRYKPRYGCGKCQTGVPCETRIPQRLS